MAQGILILTSGEDQSGHVFVSCRSALEVMLAHYE